MTRVPGDRNRVPARPRLETDLRSYEAMSVVSVISPGNGSGAAHASRARASHPNASPATESPPDGSPAEPISCQAYERLMAGEAVSWGQILREHPMLGQITVTELVNAGVVQVEPDYDPATGQTDFQLRKRAAERVAPGLARQASGRQAPVATANGGPASGLETARITERKLKVIRPR